MRDIKIDIKTAHIQALLEGKKLIYDTIGQARIILYPDRYGVFITYEKFAELRHQIGFGIMADPDKFFREIFGDEMFEKYIQATRKP
jgi:hypothetical protein